MTVYAIGVDEICCLFAFRSGNSELVAVLSAHYITGSAGGFRF
jgi:hypothetical protein